MPSKSYKMDFPDTKNRIYVFHVSYPQLLSLYFIVGNSINIHNRQHHGEISLEQNWHTKDPWFHIKCSIYWDLSVDAFNL